MNPVKPICKSGDTIGGAENPNATNAKAVPLGSLNEKPDPQDALSNYVALGRYIFQNFLIYL